MVSTASIAVGSALLALVLYWVLTNTLEDIETVIILIVLLIVLASIVALVKRGHIQLGAWILNILMLVLNLSDMAWYGVSTVASAGFIISILLAMFSIGTGIGMGVAILGCLSAFLVSYLASTGVMQTEIPFQESTLSFDAPTLSLIYLVTGAMAANWVKSTREAFK